LTFACRFLSKQAMVQVQMLAELEEVIQYKLVPERREAIKQKWWDRLQGCQRIVEDWQRILQLHSLVVKPKDDMRSWLKFSSLCRRNERLAQSHRTLVTLLGSDPSLVPNQPLPTAYPAVTFGYIKHMWQSNQKENALRQLHHFVQTELPANSTLNHLCLPIPNENAQRSEHQKLLARCYLKLGQWEECMQGINESSIPMILRYYQLATEHDSDWYKAWHAWAYMNFEAVLFFKHQTQQGNSASAQPSQQQQPQQPHLHQGGAGETTNCDSARTGLAYGRDLAEALEWCKKYQRSLNVKDLTQAWDLYYHVFRRISKQLPQMAPDYDHLTLMQKVEVFEHALEHTNGDDLAKLLWLKSPSSEVWFDRRTNYTRSLAVMSMVGYVLGLGDRYPIAFCLLCGTSVLCIVPDILEAVDIGSQPTAKKAVDTVSGIGDGEAQPEALNKKALAIINRVRDKLTGRDFAPDETLDVPEQVELLIKQATSHENLCQCYIGWCPFW
ncbi:hypothetical protein V5799_027758, partial [Amblyomma americanum]